MGPFSDTEITLSRLWLSKTFTTYETDAGVGDYLRPLQMPNIFAKQDSIFLENVPVAKVYMWLNILTFR